MCGVSVSAFLVSVVCISPAIMVVMSDAFCCMLLVAGAAVFGESGSASVLHTGA